MNLWCSKLVVLWTSVCVCLCVCVTSPCIHFLAKTAELIVTKFGRFVLYTLLKIWEDFENRLSQGSETRALYVSEGLIFPYENFQKLNKHEISCNILSWQSRTTKKIIIQRGPLKKCRSRKSPLSRKKYPERKKCPLFRKKYFKRVVVRKKKEKKKWKTEN